METGPHNEEQKMAADCPVHPRILSLPMSQAISMCSFTVTFPTNLKSHFLPQDGIMKNKAGKPPALWNPSLTLLQHLSSFGPLDVHLH